MSYFANTKTRGRPAPFHVLPDFLTGADQARLAFALGSIFGLIYNQGTFFYYRPADVLATLVQLANGLTNALQAFLARDGLAHEVSERVGAFGPDGVTGRPFYLAHRVLHYDAQW